MNNNLISRITTLSYFKCLISKKKKLQKMQKTRIHDSYMRKKQSFEIVPRDNQMTDLIDI